MRGSSLSDRLHLGIESCLLFPRHSCDKFCCLLIKLPLAKAARLWPGHLSLLEIQMNKYTPLEQI